jgi:hypothetical protein
MCGVVGLSRSAGTTKGKDFKCPKFRMSGPAGTIIVEDFKRPYSVGTIKGFWERDTRNLEPHFWMLIQDQVNT